jgi:hypothetical protein
MYGFGSLRSNEADVFSPFAPARAVALDAWVRWPFDPLDRQLGGSRMPRRHSPDKSCEANTEIPVGATYGGAEGLDSRPWSGVECLGTIPIS